MRTTLLAGGIVIIVLLGYLVYTLQKQSQGENAATSTSPITTSSSTPLATVPVLHPVHVSLTSGKTFTLSIPSGYTLSVATDGFRAARFMALSPDRRLFLGEMASASDNSTGRVIVMGGFATTSGKFTSTHTYLGNLRNPNDVAFYEDPSGQEWLYVATTDRLLRYEYHAGDLAPRSPAQVMATFPDFGPSAAEGGWHLTRTLAFGGDKLYVSVGSGCNSCEEPGVARGDIEVMRPDGSDRRVYAKGLRNAVGITYAKDALYATVNEADHLGDDRPNDVVYKIADGANYGWPYCYQFDGKVYGDTGTAWKTPVDCTTVPLAFTELPPHSAPLGITYIDTSFADPALKDTFLVAMHGSGEVRIGNGYELGIVREGAPPIPLISGFLQNGTRVARPVYVLPNDTRSFFLSDDFNGAIYYLRYAGT